MATTTTKPKKQTVCRIARDELQLQLGDPEVMRVIDQAMKEDDPVAWLRAAYAPPAEVQVTNSDPEPAAEEGELEQQPAVEVPAESAIVNPQSAMLEVPLGDLPGGYISRLVDFRLDPADAQTAARILAGLRAANAELKSGRRVETLADIFRWFVQQAAPAA